MSASSPAPFSTARAATAGFCASLVGIGLGRFAYTPLIPVLAAYDWFTPAEAVLFGAFNLAGYLAGALLARQLARRIGTRTAIRAMMLAATLSFFACALHPAGLHIVWYTVWRTVAGLAGGIIMVLASTAILPHVAPGRRGLVGGLIFTGVGLGIFASGSLLPLLLRAGLVWTWIAIGLLAAAMTTAAWNGWPDDARPLPHLPPTGQASAAALVSAAPLQVRAFVLTYALTATALVPHMVFLSIFVAQGLGQGVQAGAHAWALFGFGAVIGPLLAGRLADAIGFKWGNRLSFLLQAIGIAAPALTQNAAALAASIFIVGVIAPAIGPLTLGRIQELLPGQPTRQRAAWSQATIAFALFQAGSAYLDSLIFTATGRYTLIFGLGSAAACLMLLIDCAAARRPTSREPSAG